MAIELADAVIRIADLCGAAPPLALPRLRHRSDDLQIEQPRFDMLDRPHTAASLRSLRAMRKKRGQELRYVYVTEGLHGKSEDEYFGGDGRLEDRRLHHHAVFNGVGPDDLEEIQSLWQGGGYVRIEPVDVHYYRELAKYLTKEPREFGRARPGEHAWRASHCQFTTFPALLQYLFLLFYPLLHFSRVVSSSKIIC